MGVLFGLGAALTWGISDYVTAKLTRDIGVLRALAWTQALSIAIFALGFIKVRPELPQGTLWLVLLGMGTAHVVGTLFLYRAFAIGTLAVVGPVSAAYTLLTAGLSLFSGHKIGPTIIAGTLLTLGGIALITQKRGDKSMSGVLEALLGALCYGLVFWSLSQITDEKKGDLSYLWPLMTLRLFAVGGSYALILASRQRAKMQGDKEPALSAFHEPPWQPRTRVDGTVRAVQARPLIIGVAVLDTVAWLCMSGGFASGGGSSATLTTALSSLSHAVTVLMAWFFLHDKLTKLQWAGVAVVLGGVFLLSL